MDGRRTPRLPQGDQGRSPARPVGPALDAGHAPRRGARPALGRRAVLGRGRSATKPARRWSTKRVTNSRASAARSRSAATESLWAARRPRACRRPAGPSGAAHAVLHRRAARPGRPQQLSDSDKWGDASARPPATSTRLRAACRSTRRGDEALLRGRRRRQGAAASACTICGTQRPTLARQAGVPIEVVSTVARPPVDLHDARSSTATRCPGHERRRRGTSRGVSHGPIMDPVAKMWPNGPVSAGRRRSSSTRP